MDFGFQGVYGSALTKCFNLFKKKTKKNFTPKKDPLKFFGVQNISHGNGSSAFVFQVTGILKPVTVSTDKGLHSPMVGCNSLCGSNFDFRMTYLSSRHPRRKLRHFGCKLLNKSQ